MKRVFSALTLVCLSAVADDRNVTVAIGSQTMTALKSPWVDYFGTHYASASDEGAGKAWNTVRDYSRQRGPFPGESNDAPALKGPFKVDTLRLELPRSDAPRKWGVGAIQYSSITPGEKIAVAIDADPNGLAVRWERDVPEPVLLLLKARQ